MSDAGNLTPEVFQQVIDRLVPPLYYALSELVERGKVLHYKGPSSEAGPYGYHEYVILHPDDMPELQRQLTARRLVPLKEAQR